MINYDMFIATIDISGEMSMGAFIGWRVKVYYMCIYIERC